VQGFTNYIANSSPSFTRRISGMTITRGGALFCCRWCQRSARYPAAPRKTRLRQAFFPFDASGGGGIALSSKGVIFNFSRMAEIVVIFLPIATVLLHVNNRISAKKKKLISQIAFIHSMGGDPYESVKRIQRVKDMSGHQQGASLEQTVGDPFCPAKHSGFDPRKCIPRFSGVSTASFPTRGTRV
jgi:hypothetical protein